MEIKWPPLYKTESSRFTLSPRLFASWVQFLLFNKEEEAVTIDLESDSIKNIAEEMQSQLKGGKRNGKTIKN